MCIECREIFHGLTFKIKAKSLYFYDFLCLGIKDDQTSRVQWQKIHTGQDEDMVSIYNNLFYSTISQIS